MEMRELLKNQIFKSGDPEMIKALTEVSAFMNFKRLERCISA
jgi:3-methyladenine DNA glycosylase Tag